MAWPFARKGRNDETRLNAKAAAGFVALHVQGEANWTRRDYAGLSREGFMRNPVAHRAVRMIAEAAAAVPWLLYAGRQEISAHPVLDILANPNPAQTGNAFMEALYGHLLLAGNAYAERISAGGAEGELHLIRPDRVKLLLDANGWPDALDIRHGTAKRIAPLGLENGQGALHLRLFHPLDDHYGFAPLEAAQMALDLHNAAGRWNKALLDNSARPSGALVYAPKEGGNLTDEQFERLKAELEEGYSGPGRAGRPLLLEGGLDWKPMALSPKDMDFLEARNGAAREIALAFGVPPMLLGIPGDNTFANFQEANRAFYRLTVLPLIGRTAQALGRFLADGEDVRLWYDADRIEGLAAEREALWSRLSAASFLTDAEKREAAGYSANQSTQGAG